MSKFVSVYQPVTSNNFYSTINSNKHLELYKVTDKYLQKYAKSACKSKEWESLPFQEFVKVFMGENTPYNSILITWGTGVGKTCGAVQITETLRTAVQMFNKTIYIIAPANLQQNYKESLLSDCSGIRIPKNIKPEERESYISSVYKFYSYIKFGRLIESLYEKGGADALMQKFSNCVFVIDEAHNLNNLKEDIDTEEEIKKMGKTDNENIERKLLNTLEILFESIKNTKLIMLTATPIRNEVREIVSLLNLLRINNNQPRVDEKLLFNNNQIDVNYLLNQLKGYVSYVRGNSQISFPKIEETGSIIQNYPDYDAMGKPLNYRMTFTKVIECEMRSYQLANYLYYVMPKRTTGRETGDMFNNQLTTISNVIIPVLTDQRFVNSALVTNKKSLEQVIKYNKQTGKYDLLQQGQLNNDGPIEKTFFLSEKYLPYFSTKMATLLENLTNNEGVHYVYSRLVEFGTNLISIACQLYGWSIIKVNSENEVSYRYTIYPNTNIERRCWCGKLESNHSGDHSFDQGHIIVYTGQMNTNQKILKNYLAIVNSKENKRGQLCKVFIGSRVSGEGVNYRRLRYVHIFEPWWNNTVLQQVIGRAARNCSHYDLEPGEQNVFVFKYVSVFPKNYDDLYDIQEYYPNFKDNVGLIMDIMDNRETVDMSMYRLAENKDIYITFLTRLLKVSAVDCENNYLWNRVWTQAEINEMEKTKKYIMNGKEYPIDPRTIQYLNKGEDDTFDCEYGECKYDCMSDSPALKATDDMMLYSYVNVDKQKIIVKINQIIKFIQSLHTPMFSLTELLKYFNVTPENTPGFTKFDYYNIYDAITEMLTNQDVVFDWNGMTGRLVLVQSKHGMIYCFDVFAKYIDNPEMIPQFFKYNNVFTNGSDIEIKMNIVNKPTFNNINYNVEIMNKYNELVSIENGNNNNQLVIYIKMLELLDNMNDKLIPEYMLTLFNLFYEFFNEQQNYRYKNVIDKYMIDNFRTTPNALGTFYISWTNIVGTNPEKEQDKHTGELKTVYNWIVEFYCRLKIDGIWKYYKIIYKVKASDPYEFINFTNLNINYIVQQRIQSDKYFVVYDEYIREYLGNIMTEILRNYNMYGQKNAINQAAIVYEYFAPNLFEDTYNVRIVNQSRGNYKRDNKIDKRSISTGQECITTTKQSLIRSLQTINGVPEIDNIVANIKQDDKGKIYQNNTLRCKSIEYTFRMLDLQKRNGLRWFYTYGDYDLGNYKI